MMVGDSRRNRLSGVLVGLFVFGLALVPRLAQADTFITPDEMRWVCRSINFRNALLAGDGAGTYQSAHPGVVTMWVGGAAVAANGIPPDSSLSTSCRTARIIDFQPREELYQMRDLLYAARRLMAVVLSLAVVAMTWFTVRLFGWPAGLLAAGLLAFDPFLLAHSRVLHLDALTTSFMVLALLCLLLYIRTAASLDGSRPQGAGAHSADWRYLALVGGLSGLAIVNKTPALFMAPFVAAALAVVHVQARGLSRAAAASYLRDGLLVAAAALVAALAVWPALWVRPADTLAQALGQAADYAEAGAQWSDYFLGEIGSDPGPLFYPVVVLFRTTPLVWLGLMAAVAAGWPGRFRTPGTSDGVDRRSLAILFSFVLAFVAFMTLGAKKGGRYVLEIFPVLDILAGVGLAWAVGRIPRLRVRVSPGVSVGMIAGLALVLLQAVYSLSYLPYFLSYYNPLLGGSATAQDTLKIGWGEGLYKAADYLNRQPDARNLRAATWYIDSFAPLFQGYSSQLNGMWADISEIDYVLLYVNDLQRGIHETTIDRFYQQMVPEHVVTIHGIDYVYIYRNPWREVKTPQHPMRVELGDGLRLLGYDLEAENLQTGGRLNVKLYWQCERRTSVSYTAFTHLLASDGRMLGQHDGVPDDGKRPTDAWFPGETVVDSHVIRIDPAAPAGPYSLAVGLYDFQSHQRLPAYSPTGGRLPDDRILIPVSP